MPIYEYKCQQCGMHFEKRQSVSDAPLTTCEKCHGKLEKQWSLSGFQFKGAGWYVTDYAGKKADSSEKKASTESTASTETASKSKDEAKPAAKETVSKPATE
ncbi:MAG: zinc ribbon domain-containing protein [Chloracidobacterium sp.]|nr:zinc ribbon domain-containing protein [Chloracidobacterium sp.]